MATKGSNRSGNEVQGAFGDQDKQETHGQTQTKYDKDSTLKLPGEKNEPYTSENQTGRGKASPHDPE
ncbi:MAG: hypothetical protein JWP00_3679 [Chloroflexi bacterium]|jgi:hypothetical protein|nr:hypothetical protein [Chloroflexota bacterium]